MKNETGVLITFEGLDFSGKTTQANMLIARLRGLLRARSEGMLRLSLIREPGGTRISERIREMLLDRTSLEITDLAELFLFSASRSQLVEEVIGPGLEKGEIMVCDRFYDSTTAYQGYGRGIDIASINAINRIATKGIVPTLTILVDITVEEIVRRKKKAGVPFDRMENLGRIFYESVRTGYLNIAEKEPGRFVVVNGMGPVQEVQREVWRAVEERLSITEEQAVRGSE